MTDDGPHQLTEKSIVDTRSAEC